MRKILLLMGAFVVIILLATLGFNAYATHSKTSAARKTADTFITYELQGNGAQSYAMLTSGTRSSIAQDDWELQAGRFSAFFLDQKKTYSSTASDGTNITVKYTITGLDGQYTLAVILTRSNAVWQVQQFTSTKD